MSLLKFIILEVCYFDFIFFYYLLILFIVIFSFYFIRLKSKYCFNFFIIEYVRFFYLKFDIFLVDLDIDSFYLEFKDRWIK